MAAPIQASWQEVLIELIRERPCLYDKSHRDYHDSKGVKQNLWLEVVQHMESAGFKTMDESPTSE